MIKAGVVFAENNLCVKRNDKGMLAREWDIVIGKQASKDYMIDEEIVL